MRALGPPQYRNRRKYHKLAEALQDIAQQRPGVVSGRELARACRLELAEVSRMLEHDVHRISVRLPRGWWIGSLLHPDGPARGVRQCYVQTMVPPLLFEIHYRVPPRRRRAAAR